MRTATCVALILTLVVGSALAPPPSTLPTSPVPEKSSQPAGVPSPQPQVGGENIPTAVQIPALPYTDDGNTCGYLNDYDEVCPYSGSTSPDVVYLYGAPASGAISISLCASYYDTKLYLYQNVYTPGNPYFCNDDACAGPNYPFAWLSQMDCVPVLAGNSYYIVVDGYGGSCGDYVMEITECVPCAVDCPPGSLAEGEPDCGTNYSDHYNGGCNSTPNVFTSLPCDDVLTVCGTYGGFLYNGIGYRDTDWYEVHVPTAGFPNVTICAQGEHPTVLGYIDGNAGCAAPSFVAFTLVDACQLGCINADLPPGPAWIFVGTNGFGPDFPCGANYVLTVQGLSCPVPVEQTSWGEIKAKYKE